MNTKQTSIRQSTLKITDFGELLKSRTLFRRFQKNKIHFSPRWDEAHTFRVWLPEISMLEIIVYDKDKRSRDDKLAYCYLPMEYIREGYRNVSLYNKDGASLHPANLFFNVEIDRN